MNPLDFLEIDIDFFYIVAGLFAVVSLVGLIFFAIMRYHFKKFNLRHDPKSAVILWWCSAVYVFLFLTGSATIAFYLVGG